MPLSDLTKPIIQKNYNNGEPFVPIEVFARMLYPKDYENCLFYKTEDNLCFETINGGWIIFPIKNTNLWEYRFVQLLLRWHFDLLEEGIEKVLVTDEFNPY